MKKTIPLVFLSVLLLSCVSMEGTEKSTSRNTEVTDTVETGIDVIWNDYKTLLLDKEGRNPYVMACLLAEEKIREKQLSFEVISGSTDSIISSTSSGKLLNWGRSSPNTALASRRMISINS